MKRTRFAIGLLAFSMIAVGAGMVHGPELLDPLSERNCARIADGMKLEEVTELLGPPNEPRKTSLLLCIGVSSAVGAPPDAMWTGPRGTFSVYLDENQRVREAWFVSSNRRVMLPRIRSCLSAISQNWNGPSTNLPPQPLTEPLLTLIPPPPAAP
jgi:hypothetical protein